jgi:argininosuccinate lyase
MRERLKSKPNEVMCKYLYKPRILEAINRSSKNMLKNNFAHVLMLYKQKIIDIKAAQKLIKILLKLEDNNLADIEMNPEIEDLHFNIEQYIISKIGPDIGGQLHTARSRNDLYATIDRMDVREKILPIFNLLLDLRSVLLDKAKKHTKTVFTGYTHTQPAQPITFAHYLIAISQAIERDFTRLNNAYKHLNLCPLGSGALAGTSFNIDSYYTAELLGFDNLMENTLDAVATRDYILEIASSFTILGSDLSRLAHDFYIWSTNEFNLIELDDSISGTSSIMPQKKNPSALEHVKAKASHLFGAFSSVFCCLKNIPYTHVRDDSESIHLFWESVSQIEAMLKLISEVIRSMKINSQIMGERVNRNFCTATELSDELVKREGIPFRKAHQIVGNIVKECHQKGLFSKDITLDILNKKFLQYTSKRIDWSQEDLTNILDAKKSIYRKKSVGSPLPEESERIIDIMSKRLEKDFASFKNKNFKLKEAEEKLSQEIENIIKK